MFAQESVMEIQKESEAFEAHIKHIHPDLPDAWYKRDENGRYPEGMQQDWELWQAAKAQAVPEGFVLMPLEIDDFDHPITKALEKGIVKDLSASVIYKAMIEAQEQSHE